MPPMEMDEFKFPDEIDEKDNSGNDFDIEIEDDTPEEDRGRKPMPKEIVDEIEKDELESYSDDVKTKFKQLKKVYHDQRRTADEAQRERDAAIEATRRLMEENKKFKSMIQNGEKEYVGAMQNSASLEMEMAKKAYREAYDSGDPDQILEAQEKLTATQLKLERVNNFKLPPLQEDNYEVQSQQNQVQQVQPDPKVMAWQKRNSWFGKNRAMTAYALGVHEDLRDSGVEVGSDMYYSKLDKTIRKTFSDYFDDEQEEAPKKAQNVVASAKRTTSSKKVTLRRSQVLLAKKLGITPEQYVKEFLKLES